MATYEWGKDFLSIKCNGEYIHNVRFAEGSSNTYNKYIGSAQGYNGCMASTASTNQTTDTIINVGFNNKIQPYNLYETYNYRYTDDGADLLAVANSTPYYNNGVDDRGVTLIRNQSYKAYQMPARHMRTGTGTTLGNWDSDSRVCTPKDINAYTRTNWSYSLRTEYNSGYYADSSTNVTSGGQYHYGMYPFGTGAESNAWQGYAHTTSKGTYANKSMFAWPWKPVGSGSTYLLDMQGSTDTSGFGARVRIIGAWAADFSNTDSSMAYTEWRTATTAEWQAVVRNWGNLGQWYPLNYQRNQTYYGNSGLSYTEAGGCFYKTFDYSLVQYFRSYHLRMLFEVEIGGTRRLTHVLFDTNKPVHYNSIGMLYNLYKFTGGTLSSYGKNSATTTSNSDPYYIGFDAHKVNNTGRSDQEGKWRAFFAKGGKIRIGTACTSGYSRHDVKFADGTNIMTSYNPNNWAYGDNANGELSQHYMARFLCKLDTTSVNSFINSNNQLYWECHMPANSSLHNTNDERNASRWVLA
jgi:hypothetical protein